MTVSVLYTQRIIFLNKNHEMCLVYGSDYSNAYTLPVTKSQCKCYGNTLTCLKTFDLLSKNNDFQKVHITDFIPQIFIKHAKSSLSAPFY